MTDKHIQTDRLYSISIKVVGVVIPCFSMGLQATVKREEEEEGGSSCVEMRLEEEEEKK